MPIDGIHSVTVPGAVAGWTALHARFGRLPLADLLAPAVYYAEHGFPVSDIIATRWALWTDKLARDPRTRSKYLPAPTAGSVFRNRDLARSLRSIAADGHSGFYEGEIADAILKLTSEHGGLMTSADLREFDAEWTTPIS